MPAITIKYSDDLPNSDGLYIMIFKVYTDAKNKRYGLNVVNIEANFKFLRYETIKIKVSTLPIQLQRYIFTEYTEHIQNMVDEFEEAIIMMSEYVYDVESGKVVSLRSYNNR